MCRGINHGDRRCPSDTSAARQRRRRAVIGQALYNDAISVSKIDNKLETDCLSPMTMTELMEQAKTVNALLHTPVDKDPRKQQIIDKKNELLVTRLGVHLGLEAEKRAKWDSASFLKECKAFHAVGDLEAIKELQLQKRDSLVKAYKAVIAEIRPVGGIVPGHAKSDLSALKTLNSTVGKDFPTAWLDESGKTTMIVESSDDRPQYAHGKRYSGDGVLPFTIAPHVSVEQLEKFQQALSEDGDKVTPSGQVIELDVGGGNIMHRVIFNFPERVPFDPSEDKADKNGRPLGAGWKHGHTLLDRSNRVSPNKQWYRHAKQQGQRIPTLALASKASPYSSGAVPYHEFCHRAENVVGDNVIPRLEESFLNRRTTHNGIREPLSLMFHDGKPLDLKEAELGRKSDFMDHYIGKEYIGESVREVLSVGSEGLFNGNYGAFVGLDSNYKADLDHRAFVLGVFATA